MKSLFSIVIVCLLLVPLEVNAGEWTDTDKTNCKLWNDAPKAGETVSWSGKCVKGYASGSGNEIWSVNGKETERYEGEFKKGKHTGKGTFTFASGNKYTGGFVDDKFNGKGTYTCSNGKQFTGNFENDKPVGFDINCN